MNVFDYLDRRGEDSFAQIPPGAVDGLILSLLSYIPFGGLVPAGLEGAVPLERAARQWLALPGDCAGQVRCGEDRRLLRKLAGTPRFARMELACAAGRFDPEEESQFAALAILTGDGSAFLSFRGTDNTLVGWKEDFNMSFLEVVPAQKAAAEYVRKFCQRFPGPLTLGGHSKGGNLAACAAAMAPARCRDRVRTVYSFDGPGFSSALLSRPGYWEMLTRLKTFIPQSSVVGLLLAREEPYTVVYSDRAGLLQHDPYSWQVKGDGFLCLEEVTLGSRLVDRTLKDWLAGLTPEQREETVDALFSLLTSGGADRLDQALRPQHLAAALPALPPEVQATLARSLGGLLRSGLRAVRGGGRGGGPPMQDTASRASAYRPAACLNNRSAGVFTVPN